MKTRDKFILNGIPYDELDKEMIPILDFLNFKVGIKTKYCCFGHDKLDRLYIMFDDCLGLEEGLGMAEKVANEISPGEVMFRFSVRKVGKIIAKNWMIETNGKKSKRDRYRIARNLINALSK